jgi:hypothetical protein
MHSALLPRPQSPQRSNNYSGWILYYCNTKTYVSNENISCFAASDATWCREICVELARARG